MIESLKNITALTGSSANLSVLKNISKLLINWPWLILSQIICLTTGFIYLRYSTPQYEITSTILVKDDTKGTDIGEAAILENLGLGAGQSNVDNEVEILKSRTLIESVVRDLQLYIRYYVSGNIKTAEIYDKSPVRMRIVNPETIPANNPEKMYHLTFKADNRFTLTDDISTWNQAFGDTFLIPNGRVVLTTTSSKPDPENAYSIKITGFEEAVKRHSQQLSISAANKQVSIITLKMTDKLPFKGEALLKQLVVNYLQSSVTDKNRIADSTIAFIDQNLSQVSLELTGIEKQIEAFRRKNHITDITEQSRLLLSNSSMYDKSKMEADVQLKIIASLRSFLQNNPFGIIPSSAVLQSPDFIALAEKYNSLQLARDKAALNYNEQHPVIQNLQFQLSRIREEISQQIEAKQKELQINKKELDRSISAFQNEMNYIPATQRIFLDYARNQQIKQELYIFLLKKRIETSVSKSSTLASGRIIDIAKADTIPISPSRQLTILLAILTGFGIPLVVISLYDILNVRISGKEEITRQTDIPLIAEIGHKQLTGIHVFEQRSRDPISEQFRTLRTNLQFLTAVKGSKVLLITSSMGGEGKTFIAINICSALRLTNKKVILVECDLRKPKIASYLNIKEKGLTEYIISGPEENVIIQHSGNAESFDVITAGTIPPNPAELLLSDKVSDLIFNLKQDYDYIILDSAPIGLVTDARLLSHYADISLYVIREKFTFKHQLTDINNILKDELLPKLHLVLNDVKTTPGYGYNYGYG